MLSFNFLYKENLRELKEFMNTHTEIQEGENCLVRIHLSGKDGEKAVSIAREIKEVLPQASVVGCSTSGLIYNGEIYNEGVLVSFLRFDNARVVSSMISVEGMSASQIADKFQEKASEFEQAYAIVLFGYPELKIEDILNQVSDRNEGIQFTGGVAGYLDESGEFTSFVFNHEGYCENAISLSLIDKEYVLVYANAIVGHDSISEPYTITKVEGDCVVEVEGMDTATWLSEKLGLSDLTVRDRWSSGVETDVLLRFPWLIDGNEGSSRSIRYDEKDGRIITYFCSLDEGEKIRISYLSLLKSVQEWQEVYYDLQKFSAESLFCYSCLFRKLYLENLAKWEMTPFKDAGICGAFMLGEIWSRDNVNGYGHGTCSFFSLAENENYVNLDLHAFEKLHEIEDNFEAVVENLDTDSTVLKTLKDKISKANSKMLTMGDDVGNDMVTFLMDQTKNQYKKICLVVVQERETGEFVTETALEQKMAQVQELVTQEFRSAKLKFYIYNESSFFFVADKSVPDVEFIEITQYLNTYCREEKCCISHFSISLTGYKVQDMFEAATELVSKSDYTELRIFDATAEDMDELQNEFKMVAELNEIIKNDSVIPYFQGIYDNKSNRFFAYEALMRLRTSKGQILFPGDFMEIAKKYGLYQNLSTSMVLKVLRIFADRDEVITLNISIIDLMDRDFQHKVLSAIEGMENPGHFVFEILETEKFSDSVQLRRFIRVVRRYGIKVAVDDFGSGYSNFIEIGNLDIDYIKINGSLTELLGTDASYDKILDSITYLSKKMQVRLIAECVETPAMQKKILSMGIRYSQGYLFSKPMSLEDLYKVSEENKLSGNAEEHTEKIDEEYINFWQNEAKIKKTNRTFLLIGIFGMIFSCIAILFFATQSQDRVHSMHDTFLIELATSMSDKISLVAENSSTVLESEVELIETVIDQPNDVMGILRVTKDNSLFDNIYISYRGLAAVDGDGKELEVDITDLYQLDNPDEVTVHSPVTEEDTQREVLLLSKPIYQEDEKIAEVYAKYYLDEFASVLDLKSFGGEAFFHLCETGGTPLVISTSGNNKFVTDDMYEFIGSLDITNGYTAESIKETMIAGETAMLKYRIGGQSRTAVMIPVPDTDWCVVSIVLNEVTVNMVDEINQNTLIFSLFTVVLFGAYFIFTQYVTRKNQRHLVNAWENSYNLSSSLQLSMETDSLTRTYSRAAAAEKISDIITRAVADGGQHAVVILDVDNFKGINDNYGHQTGDIYLQEFVSAVKSCLRTGDLIGRLGGDEFIVLLSNMDAIDNMKPILQRIITSVNNIKMTDVSLHNVSVSAGAALIPQHGDNYETLSHKADMALYMAKNAGKNKYIIYDGD